MRDKLSEDRVRLLHPKIRDEVKTIIDQVEENFPPTIAVRVVQGSRTFKQQDKLYAIGRTIKGARITAKSPMGLKVTNAKAGEGYHCYALAIDFCLLYDRDGNGSWEVVSWDTAIDFENDGIADWKEVAKAFEAAGYEWGGRWSKFVDMPHIQKRFGFHWKQLLKKYNAKDFIPGTQYVNI